MRAILATEPMEQDKPLAGENVAFTGRLATMERKQALELVGEAGGTSSDTLSRRTTMLVVGSRGWPVLPDGTISRKLQKAEQLRQQGPGPQILSEQAFLEHLGLRTASSRAGPQTCPVDKAAGILKVPVETIRRCQQFGLIRTDDNSLDFQDLLSLRNLVRVFEEGYTPAAVSRGLARLAHLLPEVAQPLAQVRLIVDHGGELMAEIQGARVNAGGQLIFDFSTQGTGGPAPAVRQVRPTTTGESADAWFETALEREEEGDLQGARQSYARALEIDGSFAEAYYNLGNLYLAESEPELAAKQYRSAVEKDPEMVCAWYNLGYALAEQDRLQEAAEAFGRALEIAPAYADAHFNFALCCEHLDRRQEAARHWLAYLRLSPKGEWADIARNHLKI